MVTWAKIAAVVFTLLCALLSVAFAVFAIVARNQSGVDDWNCREDSPGAELKGEGIYECPKKRARPLSFVHKRTTLVVTSCNLSYVIANDITQNAIRHHEGLLVSLVRWIGHGRASTQRQAAVLCTTSANDSLL
jgi:hypothetical protein